ARWGWRSSLRVHVMFPSASCDRQGCWETFRRDGERSNHEMSMLDWQTFVLQRRINRPSEEVLHAISNPAVFGSGAVLSADANGALRLEGPFRHIARFGRAAWRANAHLLRKDRRRLAAVEIEIGPWSE